MTIRIRIGVAKVEFETGSVGGWRLEERGEREGREWLAFHLRAERRRRV